MANIKSANFGENVKWWELSKHRQWEYVVAATLGNVWYLHILWPSYFFPWVCPWVMREHVSWDVLVKLVAAVFVIAAKSIHCLPVDWMKLCYFASYECFIVIKVDELQLLTQVSITNVSQKKPESHEIRICGCIYVKQNQNTQKWNR